MTDTSNNRRARNRHCALVEGLTAAGELHASAIAKRDLTVLSAGIRLDGEDRRFDPQPLVGVMEQRPEWM